jgi:hypothetical protein
VLGSAGVRVDAPELGEEYLVALAASDEEWRDEVLVVV